MESQKFLSVGAETIVGAHALTISASGVFLQNASRVSEIDCFLREEFLLLLSKISRFLIVKL